MKNQLIFTILLISVFGFSQNIKATYTHRFINDKNDSIASIEIKPSIYSYSYSNKKSIYKLINSENQKTDSIKNDLGYYNLIITNTSSENEIFKDLAKKIFYMEYAVSGGNFSAKDNLINFDWELVDEEIIIKGFKCKKAITKKEKFPITAWYCEDIPINDGPDRFYGLPGFILKIELGEFSVIEVDQFKIVDEPLKIEKPKNKSKYTSWEELKANERALFEKKANE